MDILRLFTLAKVAYSANLLETAMKLSKPLNFKVGESTLAHVMEGVTAANFRETLEEHPEFERVLGLLDESYAFIPVETQEEYLEVRADLTGCIQMSAFRFNLVCPEVGDAPVFLIPVSRKLLKEYPLTANIDPDVQEAFSLVHITEDMGEARYKRKLESSLRTFFEEGTITDTLWNGDNLTFKMGKLPYVQYGLPVDTEEEEVNA